MVISNLKIGTSYFFTPLEEFAKENIRYPVLDQVGIEDTYHKNSFGDEVYLDLSKEGGAKNPDDPKGHRAVCSTRRFAYFPSSHSSSTSDLGISISLRFLPLVPSIKASASSQLARMI